MRITAAASIALVLASVSASAQTTTLQQAKLCGNEATPDQVLKACQPFLDSRKVYGGRPATAAELARILGYIGYAHRRKGNETLAADSYDKAILFDPTYAEAYRLKGKLFSAKHLFAESMSEMEKGLAAAKDPINKMVLYIDLSDTKHNALDEKGALVAIAKAVEAEPRHFGPHIYRAYLYAWGGQVEQAKADLMKAMEKLPPQLKERFATPAQDEVAFASHFHSYLMGIEADGDNANWLRRPLEPLQTNSRQ